MHAVPVLQGPTRDDRDLPRGWQGLLFNVHYARSVACQQSPRGIATVVQPNSPADIDARGSGAAGVWAGQPKHAEGAVARASCVGRVRRGARTYIIYDLLIFS